jgi:hypothetical protein
MYKLVYLNLDCSQMLSVLFVSADEAFVPNNIILCLFDIRGNIFDKPSLDLYSDMVNIANISYGTFNLQQMI